ncbi:class I SAM-dependent methyltransferase [Actinoplanes sp. G11-F43]|uniref:class I SAM-dependent methyltransferase n=1 Tax=Actinoplanes sp. G11-F43 TaxID=3424130 RepID=UPI003D33252A
MEEPARHYWNTIGATKEFTHPVDLSWLETIGRDVRVLDYGCGYGRVTALLADAGFTAVSGVDVSAALVERGRRQRPGLDLTVMTAPPRVDVPDAGVGLVLLFAVLTCVPADPDQRALAAEIRRVLAPGGTVYVSDLLVQSDERNRRRYGPGGVFTTDDGAVCRHHTADHLRDLFTAAGFRMLAEHRIEVATMNGHRSDGIQLLAERV